MEDGLDAGVAVPLVKSRTVTAEQLALILCSKRPDAPPGRIRGGGGDTGGSVVGTRVFACGSRASDLGLARWGGRVFSCASLLQPEPCAPAFHDITENKLVSSLASKCLNVLDHSNNESYIELR
jgi:hypothetical protein